MLPLRPMRRGIGSCKASVRGARHGFLLLDQTWFCAAPERARLDRLVDRHTRNGRTVEAAAAWADGVDGRNAALVESTRPRADLVVSGTEPLGRPG